MSPQFVDFDADGHLDIVAGTFDGSPHVAFGTAKGFKQPVQILDKNGARIVINQFWNFDTKKWDTTKRCDPTPPQAEGQCTSAWAVDQDGDGDLDLLLGDHKTGHVYLRVNEGTAKEPAFAERNVPVLADGKPLRVPGTVTTMQLVDWNQDGLPDLVCGGMGDAYQSEEGGGIYVYPNTGSKTGLAFGAPVTLVAPSKKTGTAGPERPDSGLYMDLADADGDGDLDLLVGGYSHWTPKPPVLTDEQQKRLADLRVEIGALDQELNALMKAMMDATKGLAEEAAAAKRAEIVKEQQADRTRLSKQRTPLAKELDTLAPGPKREAFVWLLANTAR